MVASLGRERTISLTTYRRDGTPVSTPVWVVSDGNGRLLVSSLARSGKVRRLRRSSAVTIAACSFRGRERGPRIPGTARLLEGVEIEDELRQKYGWMKRALDVLNGRSPEARVTIEISDKPPPDSPRVG